MVNLREMMRLRVPIIAAVIGEGGSGGAHCDYDAAAANLGAALRQKFGARHEQSGQRTARETLQKVPAHWKFRRGESD
jgi:hypothetical protein